MSRRLFFLRSFLFGVCVLLTPLTFLHCGSSDECKSDKDCTDGYCEDQRCFPKCNDDGDCLGDQTCTSKGRCRDKTTPPKNDGTNFPDDGGTNDSPPTPQPTCGNNVIDPGEECDGTNLNAQTCQSKGLSGGTLRCISCRFDTSQCTFTPPAKCGNGQLDNGEECDGANLNAQTCQSKGFDTGNLVCSGSCRFDTSGCKTTPKPSCGNGKLDSGEECDGANLNNQTCQSKGFTGGNIQCNASCKLDVTGCSKTDPGTKKKFGEVCKESKDCDANLVCVIARQGDNGYCAATCDANKPCPSSPAGSKCVLRAGNNTICGWECDPATKNCPTGLNCNAVGNNYFCTASPPAAPPKCGNRNIESGEECEGTNFNGQTCQSQGFTGGTLKCSSTCQYDTSGCTGTSSSTPGFGKSCTGAGGCPNGLICVQFTNTVSICTAICSASKPCPNSPAGASCRFQLKDGRSICGWSTSSGAPAACGNGSQEAGEDCDGTSMYATCKGLGYSGGTLKCNRSCRYDTSACTGTTTCTNLPSPHCKTGCDAIIPFTPMSGIGYNVTHGTRLSWLRRDAIGFLKYATAAVSCVFPNTPPLGFGDMSMQGGKLPTDASSGRARHPKGTHVQGTDIDLAYYQVNKPNNNLRSVCSHVTNGRDQYHCVGEPIYLNSLKTAFFMSKILESGRVRVIGVDGKVGPKLKAAITKLHNDGYISKDAVNLFNRGAITWETTDKGRGWFRFHHHHAHISFTR